MSLEKAIHMKKFRDEWQKAGVNLQYTHSWLSHHIKAMLKQHGITPQQFNVLRILRGQYPKPVTTSLIRERMIDRMSDVSRIVDRLCKQGLVDRKVCGLDKRLVDVVISKKGLKKLEELDDREKDFQQFLNKLTEKEAKQLNQLLDKLREGCGEE